MAKTTIETLNKKIREAEAAKKKLKEDTAKKIADLITQDDDALSDYAGYTPSELRAFVKKINETHDNLMATVRSEMAAKSAARKKPERQEGASEQQIFSSAQ